MRIEAGGNVGIGTTSPIGKFNVSKDSTTDGLSQAITVSSSSVSTKRMNLGYVPGSNYAFIDVINYGVSNTNQALSLQPNGGNVGIGTTTPNAKLDIQGTQGQLFSVTDNLSGSIFAVADISGVPIFDVNSSGVSYFDGSLGIGTTPSSGTKLEVNGQTIINSTNVATGLAWFNNQNELFSFQDSSGAGELLLSNSGVKVAIRASGNSYFNGGNVGIGTTSFTAGVKLEVAGNIKADGSFYLYSGTTRYFSVGSYSNAPYINTGTSGGTVYIGAPVSYG